MAFVCVQPVLTSGARKSEDLTTDKTDDKDAVLIARLTAQLAATCPSRRRDLGPAASPRSAPRTALG